MTCKICGSELTQMLFSSFCSKCDEKEAAAKTTKSTTGHSSRFDKNISAAQGWTQKEAIFLARDVQDIIEAFGYHVGLTGGTLYKNGARKDIDLIIYPHRLNKRCRDLRIRCETIVDIIAKYFCTTWNKCAFYRDDKIVYKLGNNIDLFFLCAE